jgi:cell division GTPase FtsZ
VLALRCWPKISPDAKIISGAKISADMEKSMKVMLIITGVKSSQIRGLDLKLRTKEEELGEELGIRFIKE